MRKGQALQAGGTVRLGCEHGTEPLQRLLCQSCIRQHSSSVYDSLLTLKDSSQSSAHTVLLEDSVPNTQSKVPVTRISDRL